MAVDRASGTIVGQAVVEEWDRATTQDFVDTLPPEAHYCSDGAEVYQEVLWPEGGTHRVSVGKADTYTVESMNANLRTYLGRLKRSSRCFSRALAALRDAVRLFTWHYNRRQVLRNHLP